MGSPKGEQSESIFRITGEGGEVGAKSLKTGNIARDRIVGDVGIGAANGEGQVWLKHGKWAIGFGI